MKYCKNKECGRKGMDAPSEKATFCYMCGEKLDESQCECGKELSQYDRYCEMCGKATERGLREQDEQKSPEVMGEEEVGGHVNDYLAEVQEQNDLETINQL